MKTHYVLKRVCFPMVLLVVGVVAHIHAQSISNAQQAMIASLCDSIAWQDSVLQYQRNTIALQRDSLQQYQNELLAMHSRAVACQAKEAANPFEALAALLEVLPRDYAHPNRPYTAEAGSALYEVLVSLDDVDKVFANAGDPIMFSPDGGMLRTQGSGWYGDQNMHTWDVNTGKEIMSVQNEQRETATSSTTYLLFLDTKEKRVWEQSTATSLMGGDTLPTLKTIIAGNKVYLRDTVTQQDARVFESRTDSIYTVFFSPNQKYLLALSVVCELVYDLKIINQWTCQVWNIETGKELVAFDYKKYLHYYFSPDGKHLLAVGSYTIDIWDLGQGVKTFAFRVPVDDGEIETISFDNTSQRICTHHEYDYDTEPSCYHVFDLITGKECVAKKRVEAFVSADHTKALISSKDRMQLWDLAKQKRVCSLPKSVTPYSTAIFTPSGKRFVTCPGRPHLDSWKEWGKYYKDIQNGKEREEDKIRIWDAEIGKELFSREARDETISREIVRVSPNGEILLMLTKQDLTSCLVHTEEEVLLNSIETYLSPYYPEKCSQMQSAVFSPDGKKIAFSLGHDAVLVCQTMDWHGEWHVGIDSTYYSQYYNFELYSFDDVMVTNECQFNNEDRLLFIDDKTVYVDEIDIQKMIDRGYEILNNYQLSPADRKKFGLE